FSNLDSQTFSFAGFYSRRIRRIFPALVLVLTACYIFGWFALWVNEFKQLGKHIAGGAGFLSNFLLWKEAGYFDKVADTKPLLHLWSLGIEEQFYIIFPVLVWFAYKVRFKLSTLLAIIVFISFSINIASITRNPTMTFYSPFTRFWELLLGCSLSFIDFYKKDAKTKGLQPNLQSTLGFLVIIFALTILNKNSLFPGWWALLPTLGAVFIISAGPQAFLNRTVLSNKLLVWFGLISYPLYLWHYPLFSFTRILGGEPSTMTRIVLATVSTVLAWSTYKLIEKPIRFGAYNKLKVMMLCLLMIAIGFIGFITYMADGLPSRKNSSISLLNQYQLSYEYSPQQECIDLIGLDPEIKRQQTIFCSMSGPKENLKVALLGDSEANALMHGFEKIYKDKNMSVINIGNGSCPPFRGRIGQVEWNKDCDDVNRKIYNYVLKTSSIKKVILAFWAQEIDFMGVKGLKKQADKMLFSSQLIQKDISDLKKAGKDVVVIFDSPIMIKDPTDCFYRILKDNPNGCDEEKLIMSNRQPLIRYFENLFKDMDVCIFYQSPVLESGGVFHMLDSDGVLLFRDIYHLSYNGSDKVAHAFMNSRCFKLIK
ncbi:MAG: acyltransferase, partial [Candidatus Omnitrophica bacterium]|nr:acyltransferase [Candidatus Omnitrophota bacterium]